MDRFEHTYMTTFKILGSMLYAVVSAAVVVQTDSYEAVFSDLFFWAAAILGTSLMLLVEKADPKVKTDLSFKRLGFSIIACLSIVYIAGTFRASMLASEEFERNHWFYAIVMFLCAIAPELIRLIITESPSAISKGFNKGIERRINKMVGGDNEVENEVEPLNTEENEQ